MPDKIEDTKVDTIDCPQFAGKKVKIRTNTMGVYGGPSNYSAGTYKVTTCLDPLRKPACKICDNNTKPLL
jgi:hypothetical protein